MTDSASTESRSPQGIVTVSVEESHALHDGSLVAHAGVGVFEITGPAAVSCIQGLVTSDLAALEDGCLYGAALTPKGMIVADFWMTRLGESVWITAPTAGMAALTGLFQKYLPPRLAKTKDRSDDTGVFHLVGPASATIAERAGVVPPGPGGAAGFRVGEIEGIVSQSPLGDPFALQLQVPSQSGNEVLESLVASGAVVSSDAGLDLARIAAGWPRLGAEIGEKTLPQEVRFDEHGGLSHTKGCYTGQETVARLHFRGHTNRELHGIEWESGPDPQVTAVMQDAASVGIVTSLAWLPAESRHIGLALLSRRRDAQRPIVAANAPASVRSLPFNWET